MTTDPTDQRTDTGLDRALKAVGETLGRTDVKVALLLSLHTGLAVWLSTVSSDGPRPARILSVVASVFLLAGIVFLLAAVLPAIDDRDGSNFPHWARMTPEQIRAAVREDRRHHEISVLSKLTMTKYQRIRASVFSTGLAVILLIVTADVTALAP
ncbi:Pycsar system effector family protein [Streptomyces sp. CA-181903]|uniref:Pycsar system effector family protein n=1 Tax=Streptomyces sp. CA-181903 TaxID=3240055 RepID=UPI003D8B9612